MLKCGISDNQWFSVALALEVRQIERGATLAAFGLAVRRCLKVNAVLFSTLGTSHNGHDIYLSIKVSGHLR
jgi:hypothetical protein